MEVKNHFTGIVIGQFNISANADLCRADLREADLRWADLDFSCLPLWCGGTNFKIDLKIAAQIALHFVSLNCEDEEAKTAQQALLPLAQKSHRWNDVMKNEED